MTGRVVAMTARLELRRELAELVKRHPELTSPEAQARLAGALPEIEAMSAKLDPNADGKAVTLAVRVPASVLAVIDAEVERLRALVPGSSVGRSDAVRVMILRAAGLDAVPSSPPTKAAKRRRTKA